MEVHQFGTLHRALPRRAEVVPLARAEHQPAALRAPPGQDGIGSTVQGHLTPLAALRDVE